MHERVQQQQVTRLLVLLWKTVTIRPSHTELLLKNILPLFSGMSLRNLLSSPASTIVPCVPRHACPRLLRLPRRRLHPSTSRALPSLSFCNILLTYTPLLFHRIIPLRTLTAHLSQPYPEANLSASLDVGVPMAVLHLACIALPLSICGCLYAKPIAHVEVQLQFGFVSPPSCTNLTFAQVLKNKNIDDAQVSVCCRGMNDAGV
jgi:hypothetical protein